MLRHYLPSIAAFVALVLAMVFVPIGSRFNTEAPPLKTSTVSASNVNLCSNQTVGVSLLIEIETKTATEVEVNDGNDSRAIIGKDAFGNWLQNSLKAPYDPPLLLTEANIGCCFGTHRFYLNGTQVLEENWAGNLIRDYTSQPGGGILFDTYQNLTSNGAFMAFAPATYIKYSVQTGISNQIVNPSDLNTIDAGSIKDLLGSQFNNSGSGSTKTTQKVKISFSGQGKIGIGDPNSTQFKDLSNGFVTIDSAKDDFNLHLFVCKDSQGNGICDADECSTQGPPLCSDGKDNDNDKLIDFPSDKGCTDPNDGDETDPPPPLVNREISLRKSSKPTVVIQPILAEREVFSFSTTCATCTIETSLDPTTLIGGSQAANAGFSILAKLIDSQNNSISYTLVASGDYTLQTKLFTENAREYVSIGEQADTQYPLGILANTPNNISFRVNVGGQFEQINADPQILPGFTGAVKNGSEQYFLFQGQDSAGKRHLAVAKGRHWDTTTLADANLTPEPFFSFFAAKGDLAQCALALQNYPSTTTLLDSLKSFQLLLELLSLCQR